MSRPDALVQLCFASAIVVQLLVQCHVRAARKKRRSHEEMGGVISPATARPGPAAKAATEAALVFRTAKPCLLETKDAGDATLSLAQVGQCLLYMQALNAHGAKDSRFLYPIICLDLLMLV